MKQYSGITPRLGRRNFLQVIAVAGAAGALWHFGLRPDNAKQQTVRQSRVMMGTQINLTVHGPDLDTCEDAVKSTFERMGELISKLSRHDPGSELSALNSHGTLKNPSTELLQVLLLAEHISTLTDGAFDITVLPLQKLYTNSKMNTLPSAESLDDTLQLVGFKMIDLQQDTIKFGKQGMAVTLDGIGKGYVVDQGVATLRSKGFSNVYVEAGGDLMVTGTKPGNRSWRIGVRNPRPEMEKGILTVDISNRAVATSGDYMQSHTPDMRHHHIIDPRTGISPPELASATVTAPTVALADGLATAAMVLGPKKSLSILNSMADCEGLFITKDLKQYQTNGFIS